MPKSQWTGFIKDYDGAHLMECYIHPTINFLDVRPVPCYVNQSTHPRCMHARTHAGLST